MHHATKDALTAHELPAPDRMELDDAQVRPVVTGCPTETDQHVLHPLVRRARALMRPSIQ